MIKLLSVVVVSALTVVYWGIGAFVNLMLWAWPIPIQPAYTPIPTAPTVQLGTYVQQATPSNLQVGSDPQ